MLMVEIKFSFFSLLLSFALGLGYAGHNVSHTAETTTNRASCPRRPRRTTTADTTAFTANNNNNKTSALALANSNRSSTTATTATTTAPTITTIDLALAKRTETAPAATAGSDKDFFKKAGDVFAVWGLISFVTTVGRLGGWARLAPPPHLPGGPRRAGGGRAPPAPHPPCGERADRLPPPPPSTSKIIHP
ncbi:uncharacterized protein PG998_002859 [Apiospora kogelbergensis]|uniref:uncharacterized protein n=1 Tax=Apiospora kogelbergensis TaxID=1337665 RepID=UPI00312FFCF0